MPNSTCDSPELWSHQESAVKLILARLCPVQPIMIQIPTGGGKTKIIGEVVNRLRANTRILIITTRVHLVDQIREELGEHGVYCSGVSTGDGQSKRTVCERPIATAHKSSHGGVTQRINVGSYQTMIGMQDLLPPDVIIVDECHMVPEKGRFRELLDRFPQACLVGLTATPYRGTIHIRECGIEWTTVFWVSIAKLVSKGILVPPISMSTSRCPSIDGSGVKNRADRGEVTRKICTQLVDSVKRHNRHKNLIFCEDIEHAKQTVAILRMLGEESVFLVHHNVSRSDRRASYADFEGTTQRSWLVNVTLVSIGVNIRQIDCIALLRDVASYSLLVQMIGRGLRVFEGKKDCHVYDFGKGTSRFGFLDDPKFGQRHEDSGGFMMKECPNCGANVMLATVQCHHCHHSFALGGKEADTAGCALSVQANATQLMSSDFVVLTYSSLASAVQKTGSQRLEHLLHDTSGAPFRCIQYRADEPQMGKPPYFPGQSWLARRVNRPDNMVELISRFS